MLSAAIPLLLSRLSSTPSSDTPPPSRPDHRPSNSMLSSSSPTLVLPPPLLPTTSALGLVRDARLAFTAAPSPSPTCYAAVIRCSAARGLFDHNRLCLRPHASFSSPLADPPSGPTPPSPPSSSPAPPSGFPPWDSRSWFLDPLGWGARSLHHRQRPHELYCKLCHAKDDGRRNSTC
ncbi:hypothetical protein C4D60_Mb08t14350 [Musa balbisiana]|uniref:Uncharacterized protein n=1 Tax=Musa balbisiana TaxID=52838 RepID=A0A4S8K3R9_MUSBA|nr:hypothetical protein C4D60_Mb08t14350 [Musa balbisiana]